MSAPPLTLNPSAELADLPQDQRESALARWRLLRAHLEDGYRRHDARRNLPGDVLAGYDALRISLAPRKHSGYYRLRCGVRAVGLLPSLRVATRMSSTQTCHSSGPHC